MNNRRRVGVVLRTFRLAKGWNTGELARQSGLAVSDVSAAERGLLSTTSEEVSALCAALSIPQDVADYMTSTSTIKGLPLNSGWILDE